MSDVRLFLGKRGCGKSTRMKKELMQCRRVIVYDTLFENTYSNFDRVDSFRMLVDILKRNPSYFRISYRDSEETTALDFDYFARAINCCRNVTVGIEEIDLHCSVHQMPDELEKIVSIGRHRDLSLYCTSRRPHSIHPLIRSQANRIVSFLQTEPRDIIWMREVIGDDLANKLPTLKGHNFVEWSDSHNIPPMSDNAIDISPSVSDN